MGKMMDRNRVDRMWGSLQHLPNSVSVVRQEHQVSPEDKMSGEDLANLFTYEWSRADWTRRDAFDVLAKGGAAALLAAAGAASTPRSVHAADDEVLRIGYLPITDATALLVAHAKGFFEEAGVKAEKPVMMRSWSSLVEGFIMGRFNLVHLLKPIPIWLRYKNHMSVKVLAWAHTNGSGVVVGADTGIRTIADLGGKRVAVPFWYSMHNVVLQYALRQADITPVIRPDGSVGGPNECALQIIPPPDMPAALMTKSVDGYIVAEPFNALAEVKVGARMLRFTGDIWRNHPCCVLVAHERTTVQRPEWTQKVMNAVVKAQDYASRNKAEVAQLISKDGAGYLLASAPVVVKAMSDYGRDYEASGAIRHRAWDIGRLDFSPWPYPSATRLMVLSMAQTLVEGDNAFLESLDPDFVVKDLVDYRFVREALKKYPDWMAGAKVDSANLFIRQEEMEL
jgi:NitT/TauT family transport system substrate-binding protein